MKTIILFLIVSFQFGFGQSNYGTPTNNTPLPKKFKDLRVAIDVKHFPKENDPVKIKNAYYWKHATAILCKEAEITITEYGAFLFYNEKWNLRKTYALKELDKTFGTKKQLMLQGQPYVWANNWRIDNKLFGGWAMWYFIGTTKKGETVCGYETINTTSNLLN